MTPSLAIITNLTHRKVLSASRSKLAIILSQSQRRDRRPLRGSLPFLAGAARAAGAALAIVLLHRHFQPRLDESEHPSVAHTPGNALPRSRAVSRRNSWTGRHQPPHYAPCSGGYGCVSPHHSHSAPAGKHTRCRLQVGFKYRLQQKQCRCLCYPIPNAGNAQWPELAGLLLRDENLTHRLRCVCPLLQIPR